LLAAYKEWGEECLDRFNGMWAFVIYDRIEKSIFASRDRYGIKPFYYYHCNDYIVFASEIQPLLKVIDINPSANERAVFDFLVFNRTDQYSDTLFKGIKKLKHGCNLKIDKSGFREYEWYNLRQHVRKTDPFSSPEEFRDLLSDAIGLRLRSDVPVGVCLSGGLDSSSIASILINDYKRTDINTFSAVYRKGQTGDETEYITLFKDSLPNMFFTMPDAQSLRADLADYIRLHSEPVSDTGVYAQYKVMELASGKVVVTLDGQGADEMMAGYHYFFGSYFRDLFRSRRFSRLISEMVSYMTRHGSMFGISSFVFFMISPSLRTKAKYKEKRYINKEFAAVYGKDNSLAEDLYSANTLQDALLNHFEFKLEHLLKWADKNSMRFSIEARMPFLDHRLVEKTLALPGDAFIKDGMTKHILREAMRGSLPEKIRLRKDKVGFGTPNEEWFRSETFKPFILDLLHSDSFRGRGIIDADIAGKVYSRHLSRKVNAAREIWKWINLELWFREFID
jgi:asparagine synthase (glutamine-hydrolysing)